MSPADFPIALQLHGRPVLVVGGGPVAAGRIQQLVEVGAVVTVISPVVTSEIQALADSGALTLLHRPYTVGDCIGARLVFTASNDKAVNAEVVQEARSLNILANAADEPDLCDFFMPSIGREGSITVAVSTGGAAPGLSRHLRQRLMTGIGPEYARLARLLSRLRKVLPAGPARMAALRKLIDGGAADLLARRNRTALHLLIRSTCAPLLRSNPKPVALEGRSS
jgi:precorrin-2 dehydrogenase/sirohydrochlorin ferrochelatase